MKIKVVCIMVMMCLLFSGCEGSTNNAEKNTPSDGNQQVAEADKSVVYVEMVQPKFGGTITYTAEGQEITDGVYETNPGTEILMKFTPWEGWISKFHTGDISYHVTEDENQIITFGSDTPSVNTIFTESLEHMPMLEVILDKSVGSQMTVGFTASGIDEQNLQYKSDLLGNAKPVIEDKQIGTEQEIAYTIDNYAIRRGTAIKVLVEKVTQDEETIVEYYLIHDLTTVPAPVLIYDESELGTSPVWYSAIKITISVVDVKEFTAKTNPDGANIIVKNLTTGEVLENGDIIESSEKVVVSIVPETDYYVDGKNVTNDTYEETMEYTKYVEKIDTIIEEHPIGKYCEITLPAADDYGECTYELDGEIVSGTIYAKEGLKLTVTYKVTESGYIIEGSGGFPWFGKKDTEATKSITITRELDGITLSVSDFGITVISE